MTDRAARAMFWHPAEARLDQARMARMTDRIEPALTAAEFRNEGMDDPSILGDIRYVEHPRALAKIIALANDLLPADDPRKITRETVSRMRDASIYCYGNGEGNTMLGWWLGQFATVLESYLPPE